jgi:hypothetical protein
VDHDGLAVGRSAYGELDRVGAQADRLAEGGQRVLRVRGGTAAMRGNPSPRQRESG